MSDQEHICFQQIQFAAVTRNGFSDVSILTEGEADGHGVLIDSGTIDQFMRLSLGKTIPAYLTHSGAIDESGKPIDRLGKEIGMFSGFYRDGNKVRAKNFQFLDAFINDQPKAHATLVEMAQKFADKLGISPVVAHLKAWIMGDGQEIRAEAGKAAPAGATRSLPSMRIGAIKSCDFVQQPAANIGLFEAKIDDKPINKPELMTAETILLSKHTEAITAKDGEIATLSQQHKDALAALATTHTTALTALQAKLDESTAQLATKTTDIGTLTSALAAKTKEAEDAAKYDMRKAGAPALEIALQTQVSGKLPKAAGTDQEKWAQYTELCEQTKDDRGNVVGTIETPVAKLFREKNLSRK